MAKITNFTNFSGTINGLIYYTANGQQFVRVHAKKRNNTKSKGLAKKMLPSLETLNIIYAVQSMDDVINAMKKEFQTLETPKRRQRNNKPTNQKIHGESSGKQTSITETITDFEEKNSDEADFHTENTKSPGLENAVRENTSIKFTVRGKRVETELYIIILQIDYKTGKFQRKKLPLTEAHCIRKNTYTIEKAFQPKKGYTDLLFLYGQHFLKAIPIEEKQN